jgi:hypothetical protein
MVVHLLYNIRKISVADEFGMVKRPGRLTKELFYLLLMQQRLLSKFPKRKQKRKGMVICLTNEFYAPCVGEPHETVQNIDAVVFKLLKENAGDRTRDTEFPAMPFNDIEDHFVGRKITFFGQSIQYGEISFPVLVKMVVINIEKGIVFQPLRLMCMEVKTNACHDITYS